MLAITFFFFVESAYSCSVTVLSHGISLKMRSRQFQCFRPYIIFHLLSSLWNTMEFSIYWFSVWVSRALLQVWCAYNNPVSTLIKFSLKSEFQLCCLKPISVLWTYLSSSYFYGPCISSCSRGFMSLGSLVHTIPYAYAGEPLEAFMGGALRPL